MDIAVVSFCGVVLGAALQYFFTRYLDDQRHLRALKTDAYKDYVKYYADIVEKKSNRQETLARITDSRARICLYGSQNVIETLSRFHKLGGAFETEEQQQSFVELLAAMRSDSSGGKAVGLDDLALSLLRFEDSART